ncbi:MAG: adenylosuccinate synthetase [Halobacteriota archaeon]|nr:adenylosuccinate synthetase [Halobacteriota archaeon]
MPVKVVVGGQFGSEGKGKITAYMCREKGFDVAVRCGGPNSGHTITINHGQIVLRSVPAGVVNDNTKLLLAAGCLIDLDLLFEEIDTFDLSPDRLGIDSNAAIINEEYNQKEEELELNKRIGSTCTGTGIAVANRVLRGGDFKLARDVPELKPYLTCVSQNVMNHHLNGKKIVIEGTQGFGLSLYHSPYYPYATSRDTTVSGFLSEVGISPLVVSDIVMVIRTFPIRVSGNSGPLPKEINWKTIQCESGYPYEIQEFTSVTKKLRRVARFDLDIVKKAISVNRPTEIALMGVDYLDYKNKGVKDYSGLTQKTKEFISWLELEIGIKIDFVGTGPTDQELIDRRTSTMVVEYEQSQPRKIEETLFG